MSNTRESLGPAPMPYALSYSRTGSNNGAAHVYMTDANGRKIAAIWGGAEKFDTAQHMLTACNSHHDLVEAIWVLMRAHAREIGVPLDEAVGGPFEVAREALAKAKGGDA